MRASYRFTSWKSWDRRLDEAVRTFIRDHGAPPNLLVASAGTLRRISIAAASKRPGRRFRALTGFVGGDYQLSFIPEEDLPDNSFSLILAVDEAELEEEEVLTVPV